MNELLLAEEKPINQSTERRSIILTFIGHPPCARESLCFVSFNLLYNMSWIVLSSIFQRRELCFKYRVSKTWRV